MFRTLLKKAEKHKLTLMFLLGFVGDFLTLNRVDQAFDNFMLAFYVVLAMTSIVFLYAGIAERFGERVSAFFRKWAPAAMQYAFGGLLSGMLIFYGRSSAFFESWPYIALILLAIFGNETIKDRAQRLVYNLAIFFIGLFSYIVLVVPVFLGEMGTTIFLASGFLALFIMYWFFVLLTKMVPNFIGLQRRLVVFTIGLIYVGFNVLYFTNIIPPIPLSLKQLGIYHSVVRHPDDGTYTLMYEAPPWWLPLRKSDSTFRYAPGDAIYCFASVFAPTSIAQTEIYHRWEYYDERAGKWQQHGERIKYGIEGGSDKGYRGYTQITNYGEGKWRCTVETARGQALGRETFTVARGAKGELVTITQ